MFKKITILSFIIALSMFCVSFAQHGRRGSYGSDPMMIFESIVDESNKWWYKIQETAFDGVTDLEWSYQRSFKISNTLDYIRKNLDPYLQWTIYIGFVLATIAFIYLWFLMVTNPLHKQWELTTIKSKLMNVVLWVLFLSWFYFIIKVIVSLITSIFGWSTWSSGF